MSRQTMKSVPTFGCCDHPYMLAATRRVDMLRQAERARLRSAARGSSLVWLRLAARVGGLLIQLGIILVRLGGWRSPGVQIQVS